MPQVPIINQPSVKSETVPLQSHSANINGDMFGINVLQAKENAGRGLLILQHGLEDYKDNIDKTKTVEISTKLDKYIQEKYYDKDNGYFYKTGKNAMNKSHELMKEYDNYASELLKNSGLFGASAVRANAVIESNKNNLFKSVNAHDYEQTLKWQNQVFDDKQGSLINKALLNRNSPEFLAGNLKDGLNAIDLQAVTQNWDDETKNIKKKIFTSNFHETVISGLLSDGNISAKNYYEHHKNDILPEHHQTLLRAVNANDMNYKARSMADDLISRNIPLEKAYAEIDNIDNIELQASVRSQFDSKQNEIARIQKQKELEKSQNCWNRIDEALQTDPENAYRYIDLTQDPEAISSQMKYIETIRKHGEIVTDSETYLLLREQSLTNAEYFKTLDLNMYRPYLSNEQYKEFLKRQKDIKELGYTVINDTDKEINKIFENINGRQNHKNVMFSEARAMVREFENRHGRKMTESELDNLLNSFGFQGKEGKKTYLEIEKGMGEKVGFIKTIYNDFAYFEKVHNRQPNTEEMNKIIYQRANDVINEKKDNLQQKINSTYQKPNETKELTYYADTHLQELGTALGVKFTVVEGGRYNPKVKSYTSHHNENGVSRACDVSLSEHSQLTKYEFFKKELNNPMVEAIGTSDPYILSHFDKKKYPKLVDEREFDKKNGTNHIHHAHVTLKKSATPAVKNNSHKIGNYQVTVKE